jgi:hypothetical protein
MEQGDKRWNRDPAGSCSVPGPVLGSGWVLDEAAVQLQTVEEPMY